jgi:prepilin-type N-terminal cleavage/methylation domain-containing protein
MQGSQTNMSAPGSVGRSPLAGRRPGSVTPGLSPGLPAPSDLQPPASGLQLHSRRLRRSAFTLTELLVVIAIIGVLASLTVTAVIAALNAAKRGRIVLEIKQLATAAENTRSDLGIYPPNGMHNGNSQLIQRLSADFQNTGKKIGSRINPQELEVLKALVNDPNFSTTIVTDASSITNGMSAAEAVYFWLGGFSQDPQFPLSGPGGPSFPMNGPNAEIEVLENRARRFEFDLARLAPRTEDGIFDEAAGRFIEYTVDMNGDGDRTDDGEERRINLWRYLPSGSEQPYVYFDCSRYKPYQYDMPAADPSSGAPPIYAFKARRQGKAASATLVAKDVAFVNAPKFQILHSGLDDSWGDDFQYLSMATPLNQLVLFPQGPFASELGDTLTNFADGEIADEEED